jgi:hypothetical protein
MHYEFIFWVWLILKYYKCKFYCDVAIFVIIVRIFRPLQKKKKKHKQ